MKNRDLGAKLKSPKEEGLTYSDSKGLDRVKPRDNSDAIASFVDQANVLTRT